METAQPIRCWEMVGVQRSKTKSWSGQERPIMGLPTKFELNLMHGNCLTNEGPRNSRNWAERHERLVRSEKANMEFAYQIGTKSDQQCVCKKVGTSQHIKDQEMTGIPWSMTKRYSCLERPIISCPTEFQLNLNSGVSSNRQKHIYQSEAS